MADEDRASNPGTEAFVPDFDDTGTHSFVPDFDDTGEDSVPFVPNFDDTGPLPAKKSKKTKESRRPSEPTDESKASAPVADGDAAAAESAGAPVQSVTVRGRYSYLKWWKLVLVLFGVWVAAAEVGLSLFYWWHHTIDKTPALFIVLVYIVACAVAGVMLAMVQGRPVISALSLAVMSSPFASLAAAAPLYGYYHCARVGHCLVGAIPY
ncbi:MAG: hypothetical protein JWR78_994 [Mycobacterium sp.]|nr:hypothetical protein [Mycobacterium sp.]